MPGSIPNPVLYFPAKIAFYTLVGWGLKKYYGQGIHPLLFGGLRVIVGLVVGLMSLFLVMNVSSGSGGSLDFLWLGLTRVIVWGAMIWVFFERRQFSLARFLIILILAILLSFGFDWAFFMSEFSDILTIPMC
jgi:hypothetical protein